MSEWGGGEGEEGEGWEGEGKGEGEVGGGGGRGGGHLLCPDGELACGAGGGGGGAGFVFRLLRARQRVEALEGRPLGGSAAGRAHARGVGAVVGVSIPVGGVGHARLVQVGGEGLLLPPEPLALRRPLLLPLEALTLAPLHVLHDAALHVARGVARAADVGAWLERELLGRLALRHVGELLPLETARVLLLEVAQVERLLLAAPHLAHDLPRVGVEPRRERTILHLHTRQHRLALQPPPRRLLRTRERGSEL